MQFDIVANDKATGTMGKVEKSMDGFGKKLGSSMTMAAARAMAAIAAVQKVIQVASELGDISDEAAKLGVSVEMYQRLKFAAEAYGGSVEDIAKGLVKVNNVLDEAATKGGPNAEILKALGFAQQEITNRVIETEEVYRRLAMAIGAATSEEEKFALASRVFGDRQAQAMVPILADYDKFLRTQQSIRVMSDENAKALDDFSEKASGAFADAKALFGGAFGSLLRKAGFGAEVPEPEASPADTAAKKARAEQMKKALLASTGKEAGKVSPESLSMAAIGGASAQVLRGAGMKSPEQETAENTRRLVELATAPEAPQGAPTGVSRAFTDGLSDLQKVYQAHPIQYKQVPFRINAPSTR
jgi:hypothetical protein